LDKKKGEPHFAARLNINKNANYSPQISPSPFIQCFTDSVVTLFGLSRGKPSALDQQRLANTPNALLTANKTV
jgi:hypothetical protein